MVILSVLTGVSRMQIGLHYPSDVLVGEGACAGAGVWLGWACALGVSSCTRQQCHCPPAIPCSVNLPRPPTSGMLLGVSATLIYVALLPTFFKWGEESPAAAYSVSRKQVQSV